MPEQRQDTPSTRPEDAPLSPPKPASKLFSDAGKRTRGAYAFGVICLILALVFCVAQTLASRVPFRVFVLDAAGNIHVGPTESVKLDSPLFKRTASLAAWAGLCRTEKGFDSPDLAKALYWKSAYSQMSDDFERQRPFLVSKNLHQKPEITRYQALEEQPDGTRMVRIFGNLVRAGSYQGYPVSESDRFRMVLTISPNPDMMEADQFPFVVTEYKLYVGKEAWDSNSTLPPVNPQK